MKFYAGVGSRKTPADVLDIMRRLAAKLSSAGWVLRSGGAIGADTAFANGAGWPQEPDVAEIYRPEHVCPDALAMAKKFHPAWDRCSEYARRLHARNCYQVLGYNLDDPVSMLICWTPDGALTANDCTIATGGTGMAIRVAHAHDVPVRNLARPEHMAAALKFLNGGPR